MSGIEVAGLVLGAIPLVLEGLKQWRTTAEVLGHYRGIRREHRKCIYNVEYHSLVYKRNVEELVRPILDDPDDIADLIEQPGSDAWADAALEERLRSRLHESHDLYMVVIQDMNQAMEDLGEVLCLNNVRVTARLNKVSTADASLLMAARSKLDFEMFRAKFSLGEAERDKIFGRIEENNKRLEKLISTSDKMSTLRNPPPTSATIKARETSALETIFRKARKQSGVLFEALYKSWQCSCQQSHFANLRLEHRTVSDVCFDLIFMFASSTFHSTQIDSPWTWREIQCGQMPDCSVSKHLLLSPPKTPPQSYSIRTKAPLPEKTKGISFADVNLVVPSIELNMPVGPRMKLCERLGEGECGECMGVIDHDSEAYHLHPLVKRKSPRPSGPWTLENILSADFEGYISRQQRYHVALLLASSVGQLQFTEWLRTDLSKEDVLFFPCDEDECQASFHEPFIRQDFPGQDTTKTGPGTREYNFAPLGILLLELCFGKRIDDYPPRRKWPHEPKDVKQAFDIMAGLSWAQEISGEAGDDYASAVTWCFTGSKVGNQAWQRDFIESVIRPLEECQKHFRAAAR